MCETSRDRDDGRLLMKRFATEMSGLADDIDEFQTLLPALAVPRTGGWDPRLQVLDELSQKVRALSQVASRVGEHGLCGSVEIGQITRDVTLSDLVRRLSGQTGEAGDLCGELELF